MSTNVKNENIMGKKELQVAAIENGTVIDHIPAEKTYQVARLLDLDHLDAQITIGYNLPSKKIGKKGIIKIANKYFTDEEINQLSVIAPKIVLNLIKNYEVVDKRYKNGLALITDMTDAANVKLEAELALVSARINLAYCYYRLKYACQCL